jgi:hypothetical protein
MPAGLQVWNANDFLQIDETYRNLVLRQKGTVPDGGSGVSFANGVTPVCCIAPTIGPSGKAAALNGMSIVGSTYTWNVSAQADYWVFDVPPVPPAHGAGLQVKDASGNLVYDSDYAPMRVFKVYTHTPADGTPDGSMVQVDTLPASQRLAFAQSAAAFYREQRMVSGSPWQAVGLEGIYKLPSLTQVWTRKADIIFVSGSPSLVQHFTGVNIAVDVTGL